MTLIRSALKTGPPRSKGYRCGATAQVSCGGRTRSAEAGAGMSDVGVVADGIAGGNEGAQVRQGRDHSVSRCCAHWSVAFFMGGWYQRPRQYQSGRAVLRIPSSATSKTRSGTMLREATFTVAHMGLSSQPRPDHAAYIDSWLKVLKADTRIKTRPPFCPPTTKRRAISSGRRTRQKRVKPRDLRVHHHAAFPRSVHARTLRLAGEPQRPGSR
jgi:Zincin-like metallopeptidase